VGHVVYGHLSGLVEGSGRWGRGGTYMAVDAIVCELVCHDPSCGIIDEYIEPISALGDGFCCFCDFLPVGEVAFQPGHFLCGRFAHFFCDRFDGAIHHVFGDGENKKLFDAVGEEGMCAAVANSFRATGHHRHFAAKIGDLIEGELLFFRDEFMCALDAHVLGNGLLDCFHGFVGNDIVEG